MYKSAPLSLLRVGAKLGSPVRDQQGKLLLGADVELTHDLLAKLRQRGIHSIAVEEGDLTRLSAFESKGKVCKALPHRSRIKSDLRSANSDALDQSIGRMPTSQVVASADPFSAKLQPRSAARYEPAAMERQFADHQQTVDQVGEVLGQLAEGQIIGSDSLQAISENVLSRATEDLDLFACMGINPVANDSLFAHSTNVATLAIAMGATLGLDEPSLRELAIGCLVHDAGMLHIDQNLYDSPQYLDPIAFEEIAKHPIIAADMLCDYVQQVPVGVRMVVYQMHERCDGSGYPRGWTGERIHPLAKISAVADAYVAMVSPRPYRHALLPYFAMKRMLEDVKAGLFDSTVVRALLNTVSLFPLGSYCELNNGVVAKVIRSNGAAYDKPIVEAWQQRQLSAEPKVLDLAEHDLRVVKPLTNLG